MVYQSGQQFPAPSGQFAQRATPSPMIMEIMGAEDSDIRVMLMTSSNRGTSRNKLSR